MNRFPENLSQLRRQAGYTQESLAEAMGLSRQAVSKWESGLAMPEAATLVDLADLLGCSLDQLMREELDAPAPVEEKKEEPEEEKEESGEEDREALLAYAAHMDRFSLIIASGVALVLLGVAGMLMVRFTGLAALPMFACLGVAVFLFIVGGMSHEAFQKARPGLPGRWTAQELERFRKTFTLGIASAVAGVLVDVALLVYLCWRCNYHEARCIQSTALFLCLLAGCVWVFVYLGIQHEKMEGPGEKGEDDPWSGVIMLSATVIYLLLGFVWNLWHPGWIVFPIGGILCGILSAVRKK